MNCKNAEKNISFFLNQTLSGDDLRHFLHHVEKCPDCREELGTAYLLEVALERIEEGESFNLDSEISAKISSARKALDAHWVFSNTFRSIEVLAGIVLCLSAVRSFLLFIEPAILNLF